MASNLDFVEFICEQLGEDSRYKKMFGEYMVYFKNKPLFLICDDTVFVKINDTVTNIVGENCEKNYPYNGAKLHYIINDIDDRALLLNIAIELEKVTPLPKPKNKKTSL